MRVNVPGVGMVNFPDTMSPDEIKSAIETDILPHAQIANAPQAVSDPTDGMSGVQKFLAGGVKAIRDAALGAQQVLAPMVMPDPATGGALANQATQQVVQNKKIDAPLMNTGAGVAGDIVGNIALGAAIPGGFGASGLAKLGTAALSGGLQGALQPTTPDESRLMNMMVGGAFGVAGQAVANTITSLAKGANVTEPQLLEAKNFAQQYGGTLTRGQLAGSSFLQRLEKMLASLPGSGKFYRQAGQDNAQAIANAVNDVTGGDAGGLIQAAGAGKTLNVDQGLIDDMRAIAGKFTGLADRDAPNSALKTVEQYVGQQIPNPALAGFGPSARAQAIAQGVPEFLTPAGGAPKFAVGSSMPMVGPQGDFNNYQALRSLYGQRAFGGGGDVADQAAYAAIQDALDNAAMRSLSAQGAAPDAIDAARQAYAVQKIVQPARVINTDGDVVGYDPAKIAAAVARTDKTRPRMIDRLGDAGVTLRQIANFATVAKPVTSSGTAEGNIAGKVATLDILKDLFSGEPLGMVKGVAGMTMAPYLVNSIVQGTAAGTPGLRAIPGAVGTTLAQLARPAPFALLQAQ